MKDDASLGACPLPPSSYAAIVLGHGSGGRLSADLVRSVFLPSFDDPVLAALEDQATLAIEGDRIAMTTDSFVVRPLFFPGGDIGKLAVNGTVNDLAVGGARPMFLSAAFILEEGLPLEQLDRVARSMRAASADAGVRIVTCDTKVVERGKGDGVFITTTGVGVVPGGRALSAKNARPGDCVILSGTIGDHGIAVLSVRDGLSFETALESDTAPVTGLCEAALNAGRIRCMRDPTRGGLASTLNEIAAASGVRIEIDERLLPVRPAVKGACEMLGLDPLYVANEGKIVVIAAEPDADAVVRALRSHPSGRDAGLIGRVVDADVGLVTLKTDVGGARIVPLLAGEQLPRIC